MEQIPDLNMRYKELVSVVITTHNRLRLLQRAVQSIYAQTYKDIELIVVDDASDDGTQAWCEKEPFTYIHISKDESRGGNYARNLGIKASHGEYVSFLDDDDYWLPEKTEKQLGVMKMYDCDLVHAGRRLEIIQPDGSVRFQDLLPNPNHQGDMSKKILTSICTTTTVIFARREALFDIGLFDENLRFWQEYELTIRLAQRKPFYFVNEVLAVYRVDENDSQRLTNKFYEWKNAVKYVYAKHRQFYSTLSLDEKLKVKQLYWYDGSIRARAAGLRGLSKLYFALVVITSPGRVFSKLKKAIYGKSSI